MKARQIIITALLFVFGIAIGYAASRKIDASLYHSKAKQDAAKALLTEARQQAGKGSWERIGVGRIYYLGGMKSEGQAIFDEVLGKKPESSDVFRVAKVYREAGEWPKAKALFDHYIADNPKDEKGLADVGAYYMLNGDRAGAEALFDRSFKISSESWATVSAAGSYLGVAPQE